MYSTQTLSRQELGPLRSKGAKHQISVSIHALPLYTSSVSSESSLSPFAYQIAYLDKLSTPESIRSRHEQPFLPPLPSQRRCANHRLACYISTQHYSPRSPTIPIIQQHSRTSKEESRWSQEGCAHS